MEQQNMLNQQLADSVQQYLLVYNADGRYHLIVNAAVVMNKVAGYDITEEVIKGLNERYKK
jgi:Skp family chaperone for outer membrane proteins